ncbi:hypothetical protein IE81DRAFT_202198 [Ceraceosorus guamensis]|uniref:F-box domain-containing protein n=1 Tax=Ceraceosorus guamensis TaxID=1522189 RepID=A0A316VT83_9BASI|nr:hypothetical protein IE81DRAFT_202198 [Ceraceosorus guamensis]PWN40796.1 hypothetical protein IE81DRAFT_202198 [Ceraceosorus guamensis]
MKALRLMRRKSFGEDRAKREGHEAPPAMAPPMPTHQQRDFGTPRPPAHSNTMPDIRFSGFDFDNLIHDATKRATADNNFAPRTGAWNKSSTLPSSAHQGSRLMKYSPPPNLASQQAVRMHVHAPAPPSPTRINDNFQTAVFPRPAFSPAASFATARDSPSSSPEMRAQAHLQSHSPTPNGLVAAQVPVERSPGMPAAAPSSPSNRRSLRNSVSQPAMKGSAPKTMDSILPPPMPKGASPKQALPAQHPLASRRESSRSLPLGDAQPQLVQSASKRSPRAEVERPRATEAQLLAKQHSSKKRDSSMPGSTSPNVSSPPTMNAKSKDRRSSQGAVGPTKPDRASLIKPKSDSGRLSKRFERDAREQESSARAEEARRIAAEQRKADKEKLEREQMQRELVHRLEMEQAQMDAAAVQERGRLAALAAREERLRKQNSASVLAAPPKSPARGPHPPSASGPRDATLRRSASATTTQDAAAPRPIAKRGATQTESDAPHAPSVSFQPPAGERQIRVVGVNGTATSPQDAKPKKMKRTTSRFNRAVAKGSRGQTAPLSPRSEGHVQEVVQLSMQETQARLAAGQPRKDRQTMSKPAKTFGVGWSCAGTADPALAVSHRRCVQYVVLRPRDSTDENGQRGSRGKGKGRYQTDAHTPPMSIAGSEGSSTSPLQQRAEEEIEEEEDDGLVETTEERWFSDLGEHIWTRTTPDVIARLVDHLDFADVKALHQTCSSIRQTLGQLAGREVTLRRFLAPMGYRTWQPTRRDQPPVDPLPLSLSDCEAFLLSHDVAPEYAAVAQQYISDRRTLDPSIPRLALATVRAYNRVLARLRLQPRFSIPRSAATQKLSPVPDSNQTATSPSSSPNSNGNAPVVERSLSSAQAQLVSPWKPGRAAHYRVWVPTADPAGWMSDSELGLCEAQMYRSGVWDKALLRGDIVWNTAVGDELNAGKLIFDGQYLRDLSYAYDPAGHLPSWCNVLLFPPSYFHNVLRSSSGSPVCYLDILPWRDALLSSMRLVQDHIETTTPHGRYRVAKWLYRAAVNVTGGQIISDEGLQVVDEGWHGRLVIETEGTSEHAKALIARCAGPTATPASRAALLACVINEAGRTNAKFEPPATRDAQGAKVETTSAWMILRERSRPGEIWLRPL